MTFVRWSRRFCDTATTGADSWPNRTVRCALACSRTVRSGSLRRAQRRDRRTAVASCAEIERNFDGTASLRYWEPSHISKQNQPHTTRPTAVLLSRPPFLPSKFARFCRLSENSDSNTQDDLERLVKRITILAARLQRNCRRAASLSHLG